MQGHDTDTICIDTSLREEFVEITAEVQAIVRASGVTAGLCHIFCLHTTAGIVVNERADPDVRRDVLMALQRIVPDSWPYRHGEGNSPAHIKAIMTGTQTIVPIRAGGLSLGTWQGIFFVEFDGPRRSRTVQVTVTAAP
jgi:secondary thiamine-phosphate synthase enzyme